MNSQVHIQTHKPDQTRININGSDMVKSAAQLLYGVRSRTCSWFFLPKKYSSAAQLLYRPVLLLNALFGFHAWTIVIQVCSLLLRK